MSSSCTEDAGSPGPMLRLRFVEVRVGVLRGRQGGRSARPEPAPWGPSCIHRGDERGIDWDRIRERAIDFGLPTEAPADLEAALFADGVTSRDEVTELSGRGVGTSAARHACAALGGRVEVHSEMGHGSRFRFVFPEPCAAQGRQWLVSA